ncbi:MAG: 23S rRNA (uracil(1939)-C(5))-methyltransferase RlmD [Acidobacteria bacterium]|nr:23S rRNA (uracil(1939)-C(5))-methyltransferase RlmD [Acidobacteriota bacterium]
MRQRRPQSAPPKSAKTALVQIEKPIYGGAFLARNDGKATFVPMVLPGEQARVRITQDKKSYAIAEPEEILLASPSRVQARCPHFGICGGCSYQHAGYETQLSLKEQILRETLQRAGVKPPEQIEVLSGDPWGYRNRIRLAFDAAGRAGYRSRGSHDIISIKECPISAPLLVKAAFSASEILRSSKVTFQPLELSLFCNAEEDSLIASVFVNGTSTAGFDRFAAAWKESVPELAGVECVQQPVADEAPKQLAKWGRSSINYHATGFDYRVDHGAFFQVNRRLIDAFVRRVIADHQGNLAWDLYAGVGLFARQLAKHFSEVVAVESAPMAREALSENLQGTTGRSVTTDTLSFLNEQRSGAKPELIVLDPPRAGLGSEITSLLGKIAAPSVAYVSCDPSTLARDLREVIPSGYSIASVALVDLFPQTFHLETVVTLQKF